MEEDDIKSFTSWKLDWVNALMVGVDHREFKVAVCLLQHANSKTRLINPSQGRVAKVLGVSVSSVEKGISKLSRTGVIKRERKNRQRSNMYRFNEVWKEGMMDLKTQREDEWREGYDRRKRLSDRAEVPHHDDADPSNVTGQDGLDPSDITGRDPSNVTGPDPSDITGKHLKRTPTEEHPYISAMKEGTDSQYGNTREEGRELATTSSGPEPSSTSNGNRPRISAADYLKERFG